MNATAATAALNENRALATGRPASAGPPNLSAFGDSRGRGRIGVLVPVSNVNLEADMALLRPPGVSMHFARVGGYDLDAIPDGGQMRQLALSAWQPAAEALAACRADVILYGCTSATLAHGRDFDHDLCERIAAHAGVPAVSAAAAVEEALRGLGASRIGLASPYVRSLNREAVDYLRQCGFEVLGVAQVETELGNYGQGAMRPREVFELGLRADHADAEAVLLSCTDMRAVEVIGALEAALGKPVVTSNQAMLYAAIERLNRDITPPPGFGRLLSVRRAPAGAAPASPPPAAPAPRAGIDALAPYPIAAESAAGGDRAEHLYLNQNECAVRPSARVAQACRSAARTAHRYADGACTELRRRLAEAHDLDPARIVCGNGSAELITLLSCAYTGAGDEMLCGEYAYLYFDTAARIAGATPCRAPGIGLAPQAGALLDAVTARTKMVCVDNPNNPTGAMLSADVVRALRDGLRDDILLVLDAAYAEYVTRDDYEPGADLVERGENTVMLRTFSKIYGLAGARIGWAYCPAEVADTLNRVRLPNNVSAISQAAALAALAEPARVARIARRNAALRERFCRAVGSLGLAASPGQGSYVLVRFADRTAAAAAAAALAKRRIHGRPMHAYGLPQGIRFTIGTAREMNAVAAALGEICAPPQRRKKSGTTR